MIHLDDGSSKALFRFGLKEAADSLLLTYRYGGGKITARIRLTPDGAAPEETTAAADTTTVGTAATESPPQESSEASRPPEPAAPDTSTVSTAAPSLSDAPEKAGSVTLPIGWLAVLLMGAGLAGGTVAALVLLLFRRR